MSAKTMHRQPPYRDIHIFEAVSTHISHINSFYPIFPILGVFRLKGQSKRDSGIIFRSYKATQSPVYPIRDAILVVNHAFCPSSSSPGSPPMG